MRESISAQLSSPMREGARELLISKFAEAKESLNHSIEPLETYNNFRIECGSICDKYKLSAYVAL